MTVSSESVSACGRWSAIRAALRQRWVGALVMGGLAFTLYLRTAARHATFGDGPELAAAAYQLGVPHPTGYPLYTLLAYAFIRLIAIGEVIFRTTMLSVVTSAATIAVLYALGTVLYRRRWPAAVTAGLFAVSDTFWSQAVITEVYGLHMLLIVSALTCAVLWDRSGRIGYLRGCAVLMGLALTHHLMSVMWWPALLLLVAVSPHRRSALKDVWRLAAFMVAPLVLYLYIPWAAWRDPPMNWGDARTWPQFLDHVTGAQYRFRMGHHTFASWWGNVVNYGGWPEDHVCDGFLLTQFSIAIIWLAPIGILWLVRRDRRFLWVSLTAYAIPLAWALNYNIPDPEPYFGPSHLIVALWIGFGVKWLAHGVARVLRRSALRRSERVRVQALLHVGLMALPAPIALVNFGVNDRSSSAEISSLGRAALDRLEPNSVMFASGDDWGFGMLYAHYVERRRPDVVIVFEPFFQSRNYRLVERSRKRGAIVREPRCSHAARDRDKDAHGLCRIERFILDNYRRAPLYIAGPFATRLDKSRLTKGKLPKYEMLVERVPMLQFLPESEPELPSPELGE